MAYLQVGLYTDNVISLTELSRKWSPPLKICHFRSNGCWKYELSCRPCCYLADGSIFRGPWWGCGEYFWYSAKIRLSVTSNLCETVSAWNLRREYVTYSSHKKWAWYFDEIFVICWSIFFRRRCGISSISRLELGWSCAEYEKSQLKWKIWKVLGISFLFVWNFKQNSSLAAYSWGLNSYRKMGPTACSNFDCICYIHAELNF